MCPDPIRPLRTCSPTPQPWSCIRYRDRSPSAFSWTVSDLRLRVLYIYSPGRFPRSLLALVSRDVRLLRVVLGPIFYAYHIVYPSPLPALVTFPAFGLDCDCDSRVCASPHGPVVCPGHVPSSTYEIVTVARFPLCSGRTYVYPTLAFESCTSRAVAKRNHQHRNRHVTEQLATWTI